MSSPTSPPGDAGSPLLSASFDDLSLSERTPSYVDTEHLDSAVVNQTPVLPWDLLFLICQIATSGDGAEEEWKRTEYEVAKLDDGMASPGRELKSWREHYATCCSLALTCRFLHTASIPRLWRRVAILKKMSSTWLADLARSTSKIAPSAGVAPLKPFGLYTRELTLWRLLRPTDNSATVTHLRAFQPCFPLLEDLVLGPFLEERYPQVTPALGHAWPRLRSLRRIPRMFPGSSGRFADELARLPCLEELSIASGSVLSSRAIEALRLNTILLNPLTGKPGSGLTSLLLGAGVIRDEATLFQVLSACPNLIKLHLAGAGSQMRWSSLDLARVLDRLNPKLVHLGFRPYGPVLGSLRYVLKRLPLLEYLSIRASHCDFELFAHAEASTTLRHLELRDATTDPAVAGGGEQLPSLVDEGFCWTSRAQIALGSRRALEAARAGFALDRNLTIRLQSVVIIESSIAAARSKEGAAAPAGSNTGGMQSPPGEEDDGDVTAGNGLMLDDGT